MNLQTNDQSWEGATGSIPVPPTIHFFLLAALDLEAFERATERTLSEAQRARFHAVQRQALRSAFLGTAMRNRSFLAAPRAPGGGQVSRRVGQAAGGFLQGHACGPELCRQQRRVTPPPTPQCPSASGACASRSKPLVPYGPM